MPGHHRFSGPDRADRLGYRERRGHPSPRLVACGAPFFLACGAPVPGLCMGDDDVKGDDVKGDDDEHADHELA